MAEKVKDLGKVMSAGGEKDSAAEEFIRKTRAMQEESMQRKQPVATQDVAWCEVDMSLFGARALMYPEGTRVYVRAATVGLVKNWSVLDETNPFVRDDMVVSVLKECVRVTIGGKEAGWKSLSVWDRLFVVLLVREHTFVHGEKQISYESVCENCGAPVEAHLRSTTMVFTEPDTDYTSQFYDAAKRTYTLSLSDWDIEERINELELFVPTVGKDIAVRDWVIRKAQGGKDTEGLAAFATVANWLMKDDSQQSISEAKKYYDSISAETLDFIIEVTKACTFEPLPEISVQCQCGNGKAQMEFPSGIRGMFAIDSRRKKFGAD